MNIRLASIAVLLATASPAAHAATVTVNQVLDPAVLGPTINQAALSPGATLGAGDTLDLTITFTNGDGVTFAGEQALWPVLLVTEGDGDELNVSGTLEFLGGSANLKSGPLAFADTNGFVHLGNYFVSSFYRLDSAPISFSGLRQIITIDSAGIGTPRTYGFVSLAFFGGSVTAVPGVPEPASWAMMIGGFGLAGMAVRRRRVSFATA